LTAAGVVFHRGAGEIMFGVLQGVGVEFYRADPHSYTSILIWRTGSMEHNVYCAMVARRKGMRIRRTGIERQNRSMAYPATEADFYAALGIAYMRPDERSVER
jgi:DNA polymerase/3'-5' exonuclease PolX